MGAVIDTGYGVDYFTLHFEASANKGLFSNCSDWFSEFILWGNRKIDSDAKLISQSICLKNKSKSHLFLNPTIAE